MFDGLVQSQGSAVSKNKERRKRNIIQLLFDYLLELKGYLEIKEMHRYPFFYVQLTYKIKPAV